MGKACTACEIVARDEAADARSDFRHVISSIVLVTAAVKCSVSYRS